VLVGVSVVAGVLVLASGASAAAPRYIMVTGPGLRQPVLLDDWWENLDFMAAVGHGPSVRASQLTRRPRFLVSLFWSADVWTQPPTSPEGSEQRGWFYPAYGKRRAALELVRSSGSLGTRRLATTELLTILFRHGVPTRCAVNTRNPRACARVATVRPAR